MSLIRRIGGSCQRLYLNATSTRVFSNKSYEQDPKVKIVYAEPIWIPEETLAAITGRVRRAVQHYTDTVISLDRDEAKDGLVPVYVTGDTAKCTWATETIKHILASSSEPSLWVPEGDINKIVGNNGALLRGLEQSTGAFVVFNALDKNSMKDGCVPVTIKGQPEKCMETKERIEQLLANFSETTIWVPEILTAAIRGKAGIVMRILGRDYCVGISINRNLTCDGLAPVTIQGQPHDVDAAIADISKRITSKKALAIGELYAPAIMKRYEDTKYFLQEGPPDLEAIMARDHLELIEE